jgi:hypothetical protein
MDEVWGGVQARVRRLRRCVRGVRNRGGTTEARVQLTDQFPDPSSPTRGHRVAAQDVYHHVIRKSLRPRDVFDSDDGIVAGGEFERSCGMSGGAEDVLYLRGFGEWMEERRTGRVAGRAGSVARCGLSCIAGLLSSSVCCPRAVAESCGPLGSLRERPCTVDRGSWALIVRAFTFENRQCRSRARHCIAGDLAKFSAAEFDLGGVIRHGVTLPHRDLSLTIT